MRTNRLMKSRTPNPVKGETEGIVSDIVTIHIPRAASKHVA